MAFGWQKRMVIISFFIMAIAFLYFTTFNTSVTFSQIAWSRFYLGLGLIGYIAPLTSLSLSQVPANQMSRASSILQFFRIFMSGVGTSIYTTLWNNRAIKHHSNIVTPLTYADPNLAEVKRVAMHKLHAVKQPFLELLDYHVDSQAYMLATNDVMLASAIVLLVLIGFLFWINVSPEEIRKRGVQVGH